MTNGQLKTLPWSDTESNGISKKADKLEIVNDLLDHNFSEILQLIAHLP